MPRYALVEEWMVRMETVMRSPFRRHESWMVRCRSCGKKFEWCIYYHCQRHRHGYQCKDGEFVCKDNSCLEAAE